MTEIMRTNLEQEIQNLLQDMLARIQEIETRITDKPFRYTDHNGDVYCESCCSYNSGLSKAMASDMHFHQNTCPKLSRTIKTWGARMQQLDRLLMAMIKTDTKEWDYEKAFAFAGEIKTALKHNAIPGPFISKCNAWATRVLYMNTWAFCLENMDDIRTLQSVSYPDANSKARITQLCNIRTKLAKMLLKIPAESSDYACVMDILAKFTAMCIRHT